MESTAEQKRQEADKKEITDRKKREWFHRLEDENRNVRDGWIKRTDGRIGYVYLYNPDYVVMGDFIKAGSVYRRVWVPCYRQWQLHELQYSSSLETVMGDIEQYAREAGDQREPIDVMEAESL